MISSRLSDSSGDSARGSDSSTARRATVIPGQCVARSIAATSSLRVARLSASAASAATRPALIPELRAMSTTVRAATVTGTPNQVAISSGHRAAAWISASGCPPPFPTPTVSRGRVGWASNGNPCMAPAFSWLTV